MSTTKRIQELKKGIADVSAILQAPTPDVDYKDLLLTTGNMFAEAEYILAQKRANVLSKLLESKPMMSANEQKIMVEARCAKEARLVRQCEQLNKALGIFTATRK